MKERIRQLAAGAMDLEVPKLELLQPNIDEIIAYGQIYRGDIRVSSGNQLAFRGLVYSDDSRVTLLQNSFSGLAAYIPYEVRAEWMEPGSVLAGHFCLVYNGGEVRVPYRFQVQQMDDSQGAAVDTLREFAALAEEKPQEARQLFESRAFTKFPLMEDMSVRAVYDGLRRAPKRENSMEEFLVGTGAKDRVVLAVDETPRSYVVQDKSVSDVLVVRRNTWGQVQMELSSDHPGLTLEQEMISEQDFAEEECRIRFQMNRDELHTGKNFARITLQAPLQTFHVEVEMRSAVEPSRSGRRRWERRSEKLEFLKTWLNVLAGKGERKESLEYLQYCWEEMTGDEEPDARQKLYRAAISLWRGDKELAKMILEDAQEDMQKNRREDTDGFCAYLYLQVQLTESWEKKEQLLKILRHYAEDGKESVFLFLLMLRMDESAADRPMEILERIRDFYAKGCRSPFLYLEACRIYNRHPDILRRLEKFELQTLWFGAKHGYLTEETAIYVASMSGQERGYRPFYGRLLVTLYDAYKKDEILGAICSVLIKGDRRGAESFAWFAKGVACDIRLTRLYDYYLYTVPRDWSQAFPREIVLYFSYNSPRDPQSQKLLYLNLLRYYADDAEVIESYQGQMWEFIRKSLRAGQIDRELAHLYSRMITVEDVDEMTARVLPDILCSMEVRCEARELTEAIVVYEELEEEKSVPIRDCVAYLPVYSSSCRILFADARGRRYAGVKYNSRFLLENTEEVGRRCYELCPRHAMMRLAECSRILAGECRTENQIRLLKRELEVRDIHPQFRRALTATIVEYASRREKPEEEEILACVHYAGISREQRQRLIPILIDLGLVAEAERQIHRMGYHGLPVASLLKLVSLTIQNSLYERDELILDMCRFLFDKGQCDDIILEYLCTHFNSASADMLPILEMAYIRKLHTGDMSERLLGQMLFTGVSEGLDEVFRIYMKQGHADWLLVHAYFVVKCSGYFLRGEKIEDTVFRSVEQLLSQEGEREKVPEICVLALTRHFADRKDMSESERALCQSLVGQLYRKGMVFAWMKRLADRIVLPETIRCREWIEYHGEPNQELRIRMRILPDMAGKPELQLVMPQVYPGIYVKSVLLFEGDTLAYEIVRGDGQVILERASRQGESSEEEDGSRFARLNRLQAQVRDARKVIQWQEDVLEYAACETWVEQVFTI